MDRSKIIRLCHGQPELAIRIVQPGCNGAQIIDYKHIRLVIEAPDCGFLLKSPVTLTGCWPGHPWAPGTSGEVPHQLPALVYPAFDTDEMGRTVFRFDDKLWQMPPGRYFGNVEFNNGTHITRLDLDLCNTPFLVDMAVLTNEPCTNKGCCE